MDLRRKNMKITSEMELDFGWKTSCRKSRLSFHYFWSSSGSELKYGLQLENGKVWTSRQYAEESLEDSHSLLETEKKWSLLVECTSRGDVLGN